MRALVWSVVVVIAACGGSDKPATDAGPGDGDGGTDAGPNEPTCTDRSEITPPTPQTLSLNNACTNIAGCGGALDGKRWIIDDACIKATAFVPELYGVCSAGSARVTEQHVTGSIAFANGMMDRSLSVTADLSLSLPNACHGCNCSAMQAQLRSAGLADAQCFSCNAGVCECVATRTETYDATGPVTIMPTSIVDAQGDTYSYCVDPQGHLQLSDTAAGAELDGNTAWLPPAAYVTPEVCDGKDNDDDGIVDDDLTECSTCNSVGVCAGTVVATCNGAGWDCSYPAPDYEALEVTCDGKDNDCNGSIDELPKCIEVCDGIDNDNDGTVDDVDPSTAECPKLGVCATSPAGVCGGAAGWQCPAPPATYQPTEASCDSLDNDCDGIVDEGCGCPTGASKVIYMGSVGGITKANLDFTVPEVIHPFTSSIYGDVTLDPAANQVYWTSLYEENIQRVNFDGTGAQVVIAAEASAIVIDPATRSLFYIGKCSTAATSLCKVDLANPTVATPIVPVVNVQLSIACLAIDRVYRKLYWCEQGNAIFRAGLDGSGAAPIYVGGPGNEVDAVDVDPATKTIYWAQSTGGNPTRLHRGDLDGTNAMQLATYLQNPVKLEHHTPTSRTYYIDGPDRRLNWGMGGSTSGGPNTTGNFELYLCP